MKRRILGRTLRWLGIFLLAFLGTFKSAEWLSDAWWNAALGQGDTYNRILQCRLIAFVCGAGLWSAILGSNLRLAWFYIDGRAQVLELLGPQHRGEFSPSLPRQSRGVARARRLSSKIIFWGALWVAGLAAANRFDLWLPLGTVQSVGQIDPLSGRDLSFFFWIFPAINWGWNFFGAALLVTIVTSTTLYSSAELIETGPQLFRVAPRAAWHLLTLGATIVLWQGVQQGLAILGAPVSFGWSPNTIFGAPEAHFTIPTRFFFLLSSLPIAGTVLLLSRRGRMNAAWGLFYGWMLGALLLPSLAAPFGRSLRLKDDAEQKLAIENHLQATRVAWGLDNVKQRVLNVPSQSNEVADSGGVGPGLAQKFGQFPLWPDVAMRRLLTEHETNSARRLGAVHLEVVNGRLVYRALAANPTAQNDFPAVVYEADATQPAMPTPRALRVSSLLIGEYIAGDDSPRGRYERPSELYSNEVPNTTAPLARWRATQNSTFAVARESIWRRMVLGFRFFDTSLLHPGDSVTWRLDPISRARSLLPIADWSGADPRPVMVGSGRNSQLFWLVNGSFGSRFYPNAAMLPVAGDWRGINYLRENVLGVVDATTGDTSFYLLDPNEPLARGWRRALPTAFRDLSELLPEIRAQVRPSPALLDAVTTIWSSYRPATTTNAALEWIDRSQDWRSLLTIDGATTWNTVLPTGSQQPWLSCPFAPASGRAQSASAPLVSILALQPAAQTQGQPPTEAKWVEWRTTHPLNIPDFAGQDPIKIVEGQYVPPPPALTTLFPNVNANGGASDALLLSRGAPPTPTKRAIAAGEGTPTPLPSLSATTNADAETLKITVQYALWGTSMPFQAPKEMESLGQARFLWEQLLQARRANRWSDVARIESDLSRALGVPPSSSASAP